MKNQSRRSFIATLAGMGAALAGLRAAPQRALTWDVVLEGAKRAAAKGGALERADAAPWGISKESLKLWRENVINED